MISVKTKDSFKSKLIFKISNLNWQCNHQLYINFKNITYISTSVTSYNS